ncbi:IS200/IS605 family transposase [Carboxylicivirga mesophila]|uniref:IS200/IS605 family transposase n=1 Tax=Carboxylicivirga mesophila TaxID=1166478 RepID=A0ABS5K9U4_9BACT|nr:IS200/IS605 family transposase [Carboxylicivirga mesophila]MBS2211770.1 IS200/IS605 family transposase [Carboxylicivirga mesophila]
MSQSLSKVYVHIVFSTKQRQELINEGVRKELQAYMVATFSQLNSYVEAIYANPEHVHVLATLPRILSIASLVSKVKSSSSKWMKGKGIQDFFWQDGYAIFSVSASKVETVKQYILKQKQHHQRTYFKDELREFLKRYNVEFDERYVWD